MQKADCRFSLLASQNADRSHGLEGSEQTAAPGDIYVDKGQDKNKKAAEEEYR
jgi:hypothetical protein